MCTILFGVLLLSCQYSDLGTLSIFSKIDFKFGQKSDLCTNSGNVQQSMSVYENKREQ